MVIFFYFVFHHHHLSLLYYPFSSLKITHLKTETKSDKKCHYTTFLLRFQSTIASYNNRSSLWKRCCWFNAFLTKLSAAFLHIVGCLGRHIGKGTSENHTSWATKYLQMWHNLMCCSLTEKQIWDRNCLIVYISSFCPLGSY